MTFSVHHQHITKITKFIRITRFTKITIITRADAQVMHQSLCTRADALELIHMDKLDKDLMDMDKMDKDKVEFLILSRGPF